MLVMYLSDKRGGGQKAIFEPPSTLLSILYITKIQLFLTKNIY